jgi:hypothetical protein
MAVAEDYVPMTSTASGRELARVYGPVSDSSSKEQIIRDKSACTSDVREVPNARVRKIMSLAKRDRDAAEVAAIKAITACMAKKGWRVVLSPA